MNISAFSIRNPVPAILLFALMTVCGLIAFEKLKIQQFPDMDLPTIKISATLDGTAPSQLETEVARKIEDKLATLNKLDHITTTITDGSVSISVSFSLEKDGEQALNEVRNAVDSVTDLPSAMQTPSVSRVTVQSSVLQTYAVRSSKLNETELSWFVDNDMTKALLKAQGVGEVDRFGGVDREIHVDINPDLLTSFGVTAADVSSQLKLVQENASGGRGDLNGLHQTVRTLGAVNSVKDIAALSIPFSNGKSVRLDQIANVTDSFSERSSLAYMGQTPVIAVEVKRSNGYSDTGVATDLTRVMAAFAAEHPEVEIVQAYTTVQPTIDNYEASMHMLYEGAALAIVVVFLFLRDLRATLLSAVALPLSIIPTFLVIYLANFSLNTISLLSISLVVGILVDDAIVEVENIERHLRMGKKPFDAAMEAADEIGLAVIATTFTLVAVFLPTAFMAGIPGLIFKQFGVTAAVAVLASLMVARFLTPMMAAYMMKATPKVEVDGVIMKTYLSIVRACLRHRFLTSLGIIVFLVVSLSAVSLLKTGFFPASDNAQTQVTLTMPPGSELSDTEAMSLKAVKLISGLENIKRVFTVVGSTTSGGGADSSTTSDVTTATLVVDLTPINDRKLKQSQIEQQMRNILQELAGVRVEVGNGGNGTELQLTLASDDPILLDQTAAVVGEQLHGLKGIGGITSSAARQAPEIQISPNFARAAALGITSDTIADVVRVATDGDYSTSRSKFNLPQRQIDIRVRLDPKYIRNLDAISQLQLSGTNGKVSLGAIAGIRIGGSPSEIDRIDRSRNITFTIQLNGRALGDVNKEAMALPGLSHLPPGVHVVQQGELERMSELFTSFALAMGIGIFCIYAVLVLLFHDFMQPATILMALPLSLGGALFPLIATGTSFSMPAVIGLLMLMGIVSKNSILLVEYAIMARRNGMDRYEALIDACHKRARPIVMTTIAMGAGMAPVALSLSGGDTSFRQPMSIVVIGGLLTSTVLSLLVIPVIFTFVDDLLGLVKRPFMKSQKDIADGESVNG
ncbi:AcrB/AcrD/AcrF family protein [Agrobacterium vitis]|uniref:efflux RND transporter permease subunit n=1 Tax=Agrobacterium vitis TaxID=373 RepID=UPI0012E86AAE|nr:efflux RND transporter permease subunit [Agrobacterium vitis]MVA74283.1 AcrB/AcrD/AcrF family protein [Agrobacterium vitis]